MLEEAYEAVAAIEGGEARDLADELGDVLLQVVLHAQIAADNSEFDIDDVIARISAKIRRRHPHVFADGLADTPDEVHRRWDAIKRDEKTHQGLVDGVPRALPALVRAQKISRRVVGVGFEWETLDDVWDKFDEEVDELRGVEPGTPEAAEEIGDLLFTLVNVARKQGIDAEEALRGTCDKFARRWSSMEREAERRSVELEELGIDEMEGMWAAAKASEKRLELDEPAATEHETGEDPQT
jgi:tetrapyrrole methylase family protein/MazG family protein